MYCIICNCHMTRAYKDLLILERELGVIPRYDAICSCFARFTGSGCSFNKSKYLYFVSSDVNDKIRLSDFIIDSANSLPTLSSKTGYSFFNFSISQISNLARIVSSEASIKNEHGRSER